MQPTAHPPTGQPSARRESSTPPYLSLAPSAGLLASGSGAVLDRPGTSTSKAAGYRPVSTLDFSKIAPVHNVFSYGADATGASESAPAIQAALDAAAAAGGGVVLVPAGLYVISQILQIGSGVALQGAGMGVTTIQAASGFSPSQVGGLNGLTVLVVAGNAGGSNIVITGLTFDGNQANISAFPGWADQGDSHCLDLRNVDNLQISGVEIINAIRYSMFIVQCTHSYVSFCRIISGQESLASGRTQQDGIHLSGCRWCVVADNNVDTGTTAGVGDDAICLQALTSGAPVTDISVATRLLPGGTSHPVTLSRTESRKPGTSYATAGVPTVLASSTVSPQPSASDGATVSQARLRRSLLACSDTRPGRITACSRPSSRTCASRASRAGPVPAMSTRKSGHRRSKSGTASTRRCSRLCGTSLVTTAIPGTGERCTLLGGSGSTPLGTM
jgi:hypothetical protein